MNTGMDGREVEAIEVTRADGNPYLYAAGMGLTWDGPKPIQKISRMYLSASYHGDRDEFWIIVESDGKEFERHNCKNVSFIRWKQ